LDPERWQRLRNLFESALEKDEPSRAAYLDQACGTDPSLRREVEALLKSHSIDNFLEKPAYEALPELFESGVGDSLVGCQLGPYRVTGKIGRGGMGIVYLAQDTRLDRPVAVKMLAPKYTADSQQRERLRREARAAARLSHPGIATVYSLEEFDDNIYIVSEYVRGNTLLQTTGGAPLPVSTILDIAVQITRALNAAHESGVVHRDLKPENIARTDSGLIKILDFGLASFSSKTGESEMRLTRSGMFLGTPAYASPEQLLGSDLDFRTDIFSLGVIIYELSAGRHPFGEMDSLSTVARILEEEPPDLMGLNPAVPEELTSILSRCLRKKRDERYASTRELLVELESLLRHYQGAPAPVEKPRKTLGGRGGLTLLWWWQFHQACAGFGYYGMLYPLWRVKQWLGGIEGSLLFFPAVVAVGVAANLRFHLWFTSRFYVSELADQRRKVSSWIRWADCLFVFMLAVAAIRIHTLHAIIATLLMAVAIGSLVAFSLIEPTTTRAALGNNPKFEIRDSS
jgi:serine/threonine protein kinase